jgi:hypothetical protein
MVKTTKKLSAKRQILMAIKCTDSVDYECAITLAGAAEGQIDEKQISEGTRPHLFRVLRAKFAPEPVNEDITWMKHLSGDFNREVTEFDVALTIARAIQKYVATYQESCIQFEEFSQWAVMKKHIPRPLTEKASEVTDDRKAI